MADASTETKVKATKSPKGSSKSPRAPMSDEHKQALAEGRQHGRIVKDYLEALDAHRPRRGRQVTPEMLKERLMKVNSEIVNASPLERLSLIQQRMDIEKRLETMSATVDFSALEKEFVKVAKNYSEKRDISYAAWREIGVPPEVLKQAGVER